jgi:PTS system galactitol-specific IIA component
MKLLDLLVQEAIQIHLDASSSSEVIEALGEGLRRRGYVRDDFVKATIERERNMPTGLPLSGSVNAALPHVDLEYVLKPAVALATLANPVDFHQMVDSSVVVPVQLVIMLAMNEPKSQVTMLQQVSNILQSSALVEGLMDCSSPSEVVALLEDV